MRALTKAENIETDANILKKNGTALADSIENMLQDLKGILLHMCFISNIKIDHKGLRQHETEKH